MTEASLPSPSAAPRRRATREREFRRLRILAMVQAGWSYAAIGREEAISRERVRQIVAQAFEAGETETKLIHAWVQVARLEPALRLAARSVADGELAAIDRLLRVLDRLDKYAAVDGAEAAYDEGAREKLLAKLNAMAENIKRHRELHGDAAPGEDDWPGEDDSLATDDSPIAEAALDAPLDGLALTAADRPRRGERNVAAIRRAPKRRDGAFEAPPSFTNARF